MLLNSKLTKLIQATSLLHASPDDADEEGAKVHCMVKGVIPPPEEYSWAILDNCIWRSKKPCEGCLCARPAELEEVIATCRTSSGDVK